MLGNQIQNIDLGAGSTVLVHSRRMRRRRGDVHLLIHRDVHPSNLLAPGQQAILGSAHEAGHILFGFAQRLSKLDELKARQFKSIGRQTRITRSLTALHQPIAPVLTNADWHWLDKHSDLENEFE